MAQSKKCPECSRKMAYYFPPFGRLPAEWLCGECGERVTAQIDERACDDQDRRDLAPAHQNGQVGGEEG